MAKRNTGPVERTAAEQAACDALARAEIALAATSIRACVKGASQEKIYGFYSFKAGKYAEVRGDTALMCGVLDEIDPTVERISFESPSSVVDVEGEARGTRYDSTVRGR